MTFKPCLTLCALSLITSTHATPALAAPKARVAMCAAVTPSGLGYTINIAGTGAAPQGADEVTVKYRGTLASNGKQFDASDRAEFPVGQLIAGFTEGLKLMHPGGKARFCIPAKLAYGSQSLDGIPANSDLVFDVELLAVKAAVAVRETARETVAAEDRTCTTKTASGLGYLVVQAGSGDKPVDESIALLNYRGYLASDGTIFDANNRAPLPVKGVIPGFGEGLKLMQRGGRYKLCIPSALAYGAVTKGPIPANSDLVFDVDLLDFKSIAEIQALQGGQKPAASVPVPVAKPPAPRPQPKVTKRRR
jgi:FKBP-type peptidyl-prolyl cis-trans isomerase